MLLFIFFNKSIKVLFTYFNFSNFNIQWSAFVPIFIAKYAFKYIAHLSIKGRYKYGSMCVYTVWRSFILKLRLTVIDLRLTEELWFYAVFLYLLLMLNSRESSLFQDMKKSSKRRKRICNREDPQRWLHKEISWTTDRLRSFVPLPFKQGVLIELQQSGKAGEEHLAITLLCILQDFQRTSNFLFYITGKKCFGK